MIQTEDYLEWMATLQQAARHVHSPSSSSLDFTGALSSILVIEHSKLQSLPSIAQQRLFRDRHILIYQSPIEAIVFDLQHISQLGDPWAPIGVYGGLSQTRCRLSSLNDSDYSQQSRPQDYPRLIMATLHDIWQRSQQLNNGCPLCAPRIAIAALPVGISQRPIAGIPSVMPLNRRNYLLTLYIQRSCVITSQLATIPSIQDRPALDATP
jgi:hypothetical protein